MPYGDFADDAVAIVYPTYNDFSPGHLDASRRQSHAHTHTYIVDDSTNEAVIEAIDDYAAFFEDDVTVIRREGRDGYKAGALNHALKTVIDEPYFALMDADEVLPADFIETTITYFASDDAGFVQGNHDYNRETASRFGDALGIGVDIHWDIYQPPRNTFGFTMLLGHGALIRRDVWESIDGFPEIVSEDLAFATRAREYGYTGIFAKDVDCLEDFPIDYQSFRTRHKKWTAGSIEYILTELPRFLRSPLPSLTEKFDVVIPTFQLPLTVLFVVYIFAVGVLELTTGTVFAKSVTIPPLLGAVTVGTLLSPVYCYIIALWDRPRKLAHFIATSTTVYCSLAITAVTHGIRTLTPWEKAAFLTTPKAAATSVDVWSYRWTVLMGIVTLGIALKAGILVGTAAFTWVLAPSMELYNAENTKGEAIRAIALVPFVLLLGGVGYGFYLLVG